MALPTGVSLAGPDGGINFYSTNGYTNAANAGMDSTMIPIGPFNTDGFSATGTFPTNSGVYYPSIMTSLGWNIIFNLYNGLDAGTKTALDNAGIYLGQIPGGLTVAPGTETVLLIADDEPATWNQSWGLLGSTSAANQTARPWWVNGTVNMLTSTGEPSSGFPSSRSDTGCSTNGTSTVTDAALTVADVGKAISGTHIPAGSFILSVSSGTGVIGTFEQFYNSGSPILTTVNTTGSGSGLTFTVGALGGTLPGNSLAYPVAAPGGTTPAYRRMDLASTDIYFFTVDPLWSYQDIDIGQNFFGLGSGATTLDQYQRGSNYGLQVDAMRVNRVFDGPIYTYIETANPFATSGQGTASENIQPAQFNWAMWSAAQHGCRGFGMFDHYSAGFGGVDAASNWSYYATASNYPNTPTGVNPNGVSMFSQVGTTCSTIQSFASVLNSYTAHGYCTVSGTTSTATGPTVPWPTCVGSATSLFNGIDVATKYTGAPTGGGTFYVIVTTRNSLSWGGGTVTFNIADTGATSAHVAYSTDGNQGTNISISSGTFSDSFTNGASVRVYQIAQSSGTVGAPTLGAVTVTANAPALKVSGAPPTAANTVTSHAPALKVSPAPPAAAATVSAHNPSIIITAVGTNVIMGAP